MNKSYVSQFSFSKLDENKDYSQVRQGILAEVILPSFYSFPLATPVYTINVVSSLSEDIPVITILNKDNEQVGQIFNDIAEAYDYVKNVLEGDVNFTGDMKNNASFNYISPGMVTVPSKKSPQNRRMLLSHTDEDVEYLIKLEYYQFLKATDTYESDPSDFMVCFYWLDAHPAFWSRSEAGGTQWQTWGHNNSFSIDVSKSSGSGITVFVETGSAVEPERTSHYHDLRLDVSASTYEQCVIELAAKVHKFFDVEGNERVNVEYKKSELELALDACVADIEKISNDYSETSK